MWNLSEKTEGENKLALGEGSYLIYGTENMDVANFTVWKQQNKTYPWVVASAYIVDLPSNFDSKIILNSSIQI